MQDSLSAARITILSFFIRGLSNFTVLSFSIFYKGYVDDTFVKRKRNDSDTLFDALNSYHPNIKFTLEQNPKRFLDTQIIKENNQIKTQVFVKKSMYSLYWSSKCRFDMGKMQLMVSYTFDSKMVF